MNWYEQEEKNCQAPESPCFLCKLRSLTAKPSRQATQREKNIYRSASALLAALENDCTCSDLENIKQKCSYHGSMYKL